MPIQNFGGRQVTDIGIFALGDLADLHVYILDAMGHSICSITPLQYAMLKPSEFEHLGDEHPRVLRALCWDSLLSAPIQRELLVSVGLAGNGLCRFPLTQSDIGDALGMTQQHVSRAVKDLNATGW
jgi:hypothetical protein